MKKILIWACVMGGVASGAFVPAPYGNVTLKGPMGTRLETMLKHHVLATDTEYITAPFLEKTERRGWWQTEFWGKYMHSAMPFWTYTKSAELRAKIDAGLTNILKSQEPCGYIGNYPDDVRCGEGWDVWGMKYTILGLLHYYDGDPASENGQKALAAAKRLCDYVIQQLGPNGARGKRLYQTGNWSGFASSSILEPVVWLYNRTKEQRYLDFATYVVSELCDYEDGAQLVKLADVPVADRRYGKVAACRKWHPEVDLTKAYEFMSCYQGLIEYFEVTGKREYLEAAVKSAESIVATEVNLAGGAAAGEHWFRGADQQYRHISWQQETCVITTWMRLCEKLLAVTGDPKWADQLEKTFYNIYLGAMTREADAFAAYTPLMGDRSHGHHHCRMHTDCCNANGPRGYLTVMNRFLTAKGDAATLNFYMSGSAKAKLGDGGEVKFHLYTLYPKADKAELWYRSRETRTFTLRLRIPAYSAKTVVKVNGKPVKGAVAAGGYCELRREWHETDKVEIVFDMAVRVHTADHFVAFSRGPIALARDSRFGDGALDEPFRPTCRNGLDPNRPPAFVPDRIPDGGFWMAFAVSLPIGEHHENPEGRIDRTVRFCDFASAGNRWETANAYRTWFPVEWSPHEK